MTYNYNFDYPMIKEKIDSPQFAYSEILLDKRMDLGYGYEKMAEISDTSLKTFIKMENSDTNISVDDYIDAILNIEIFESLRKEEKNSLNIEYDQKSIHFNNKSSKFNLHGGATWQVQAI